MLGRPPSRPKFCAPIAAEWTSATTLTRPPEGSRLTADRRAAKTIPSDDGKQREPRESPRAAPSPAPDPRPRRRPLPRWRPPGLGAPPLLRRRLVAGDADPLRPALDLGPPARGPRPARAAALAPPP